MLLQAMKLLRINGRIYRINRNPKRSRSRCVSEFNGYSKGPSDFREYYGWGSDTNTRKFYDPEQGDVVTWALADCTGKKVKLTMGKFGIQLLQNLIKNGRI